MIRKHALGPDPRVDTGFPKRSCSDNRVLWDAQSWAGEYRHGPVSFAIQRTGVACAARQRSAAARAADVRFSAMGAFARIQPGIPDAMGADLAVRRFDALGLPATVAPLCRRHLRRQILSVHRISRIGWGDDRR